MEIRKKTPDANNKYYLKAPAGYNPCILGNANNRPYPQSVLVDCTGATVGRFNEIIGQHNCSLIGNRYPGSYMAAAKAQGLQTGSTVRPGCIVVMVKPNGKNGHVFNVEKVSGGSFLIFESGWNFKKPLVTRNRWTSKGANFGLSREYSFKGCIYNPQVDPYEIPPEHYSTRKTKKSKYNKFIQWALNKENCYEPGADNSIDGSAGPDTQQAIRNYQKKNGLKVDGIAGQQTINDMITKYALV